MGVKYAMDVAKKKGEYQLLVNAIKILNAYK